MKRLIFLVFLLIYLLFLNPTFAASSWVIDNFNSDISIEKSGKVDVKENISVDFNDLEKHGIYRDIPLVYDQSGKKIYTKINVQKVERNDKNEKYDLSNNGNNLRIRVGDPDVTISGSQKYLIKYEAIGVISSYKDFDELYWNATGNEWETDIKSATTTITLPENSILKATCYQGSHRSKESCSLNKDANSATFHSTRILYPGEGLTIALGFKKGIIPILSGKTFYNNLQEIPIIWDVAIFLIPLFLCFYFMLRKWTKSGRDLTINKHDTIVAEYTPPENLRPAEIGVLIDEKADTKDVTSTIIDLAARGFLSIKEIKKSWVFGKNDYELTRKAKDTKGLLKYESLLLDKLFDDGSTIKISNLKYTFYKDLALVKQELYKDVVGKKMFVKSPESTRTSYLVIAILTMIAGGVIFWVAAIIGVIVFVALALGIASCGVLIFIFGRFMPQRTAYGHELYRRTLGYRLFIDKAESYKQKFFENKNMINKVLPYTIVFGMSEKFAEAMKNIGLEKQIGSGFYYGGNYASFSSSVDTFSSSLSSAISSAPSSSGSGGGGSSGGGFGGGGGGSW